MTRFVDPLTLKRWLHDGQEIALFDVREQGQYGQSHLFLGVCLPYSRLELDVLRLAPRKTVRMVVYDENHSIAIEAAQRLTDLGYSQVQVLQGGTAGWQAAGFGLFAGVNVPSKTFGELIEQTCHTPHVSATELAAMIAAKEDVVVLDGRPFAEFQKMNIPTATSCPNGELVLRVQQLVPSKQTRIVVNCAGRTRSIIGAQTLINLGLPNPVFALKDGTQGWYLADLALEHAGTRRYAPADPLDDHTDMLSAAQALAQRFGVPVVNAHTVSGWSRDTERTLFLCDVRTPEEFAQGSLPGAQHTPGGQLIQATDQYVGVRHARLVLFDSDGLRALTVASWLRQMGHDVCVLEHGLHSGLRLPGTALADLPVLPTLSLSALVLDDVQLLDLRPSMHFRKMHITGAQWAIRPRLSAMLVNRQVQDYRPIVLIADDVGVAACAALELQAIGLSALLLEGGPADWRAAGLPLQASDHIPADSDCIDFLFFVHDRHDGNKTAARQYLAWEGELVGQLDAQELAIYHLPSATYHLPAANDHRTRK